MKTLYDIDRLIKVKGHSDLINEPIIVRVTDFTEAAAKTFSEEFRKAHHTGQPVIPVVIDSYGGYVHSLLSMISDISHSNLPVATICVGKAMSCGSILLSCGTKGMRYADSFSSIMIHDVSSGYEGKIEEIKTSVEESDRLNKQIFGILAENCGKKPDYFLKMIHDKSHAEWYLTAKEAKKQGLVDSVGVPTLKTKVTVNMELV